MLAQLSGIIVHTLPCNNTTQDTICSDIAYSSDRAQCVNRDGIKIQAANDVEYLTNMKVETTADTVTALSLLLKLP